MKSPFAVGSATLMGVKGIDLRGKGVRRPKANVTAANDNAPFKVALAA